MKNLKKTLAVVLAFAMILSMGFSAFAYTDVAEGTKVAEAVSILSNLGIFTGFEDGTFKPNDTVTRAQMAAIICRTLGYEDQAQASTGTTNFNDVPASHWASGYVNVAQSLQIVNGYGDGNFGPEDQVTYEQAIKMIVVALGYELDAQAKGGWSTGYLAVASREGISKGANGVVGSPAARGTIAVLVYNSLEVRLMDQESWTNDGDGDHFAKQNATVLSQYLEIQKWEGIVEATPYTAQAGNVYNPDKEPVFSLDANAFYKEWADKELKIYTGNTAEYPATGVRCDDIDVNAFLGKKVVAYIGEDAVTGVKKLYAISEKQGVNSTMTIGLDQLNESGDKYYSVPGVIGYSPVGSTKSVDIALDDTLKVVKNFGTTTTITGANNSSTGYTTALLATALNSNAGSASLIDNDGDGKIDFIAAIAVDSEAVVKDVTTEDGIITLDTYVNNGNGIAEDIDTEDDENLIIVYKDGVLADVNAIEANDTISGATISSDDSFLIYYVSSKTVTGAVEGYDLDSETVTIAGEDYKLSSGSVASYKGKEGIFFLNTAGKIAYADADVAAGNYGIVIFAGDSAAAKPVPQIEVVLADGTSAFYPLNSKAEIVDANGNVVNNIDTDDEVRDYLKTQLNLTAQNNTVTADRINSNQANLIYKVKVVNGYVKQLTQVGAAGTGAATDEYKAELNKYGSVKFGDSTVIFSVEAALGQNPAIEVTADKIKVGTVADFFVDGERSGAIAGYDKSSGTVGAVVGFGLKETVAQDAAAVIITSAKTISYNDDEAVRVYGIQAGKEVSFILYDEDSNYSAASFAKGDVILVGAADTEGVVANYTSLLKRTITRGNTGAITGDAYALSSAVTGLQNGVGAVKEDTEYYFGKLAEDNNNKTLFNADKDTFYVNINGVNQSNQKALEMEKGANYTLVDFTDGMDAEISRKSAGTGIFGGSSTEYESAVFVRVYDDEIVEVVVYRWTNAYGNGNVLTVTDDHHIVTK